MELRKELPEHYHLLSSLSKWKEKLLKDTPFGMALDLSHSFQTPEVTEVMFSREEGCIDCVIGQVTTMSCQ